MIILQCYSLCERGYIDLWIVNYMGIFFSKWICENLRLSSNFPHCSNLCVKGAMFGWCSYVLEVKHHQGLLLMTKTKISSYFLKREGKHNLYLTFFLHSSRRNLKKYMPNFFKLSISFNLCHPEPEIGKIILNKIGQLFLFSHLLPVYFSSFKIISKTRDMALLICILKWSASGS